MQKVRSYKIIAYDRPYESTYGLRQNIFWKGLADYAGNMNQQFEIVSQSQFKKFASFVGRLEKTKKLKKISSYKSLKNFFDYIKIKVEGPLKSPSSFFDTGVGQYVLRINENEEYKFCIDISDGWDIRSQEMYDWCDIYFRANYFENKKYPEKVVPIYKPHFSIYDNIEKLRKYRSMEKKYDLSFVVRTWCGAGNYFEGFEHNLRLIEEISKVNCKKFVYVYLLTGDTKKYAERLKKQDIPCGTKPIPMSESWKISAQSTLNIVRLGLNYFMPQRPYEILSMGGCIVFDSNPNTLWPVPFRENQNFLSLNLNWTKEELIPSYIEEQKSRRSIRLRENTESEIVSLQENGIAKKFVASEKEYLAIPDKIESWLNDRKKINRIHLNNSEYFDRYLIPSKIGEYIIDTIIRKREG